MKQLFFFATLGMMMFIWQSQAQYAWKEYPIVSKPVAASSNGTYIYIGSEGTLTRVRISDGQKDYPYTCVKAPYLFQWAGLSLPYHYPVSGLAANPNRSEMYLAAGEVQWYHSLSGDLTPITSPYFGPPYPDAWLANNGIVYASRLGGLYKIENDSVQLFVENSGLIWDYLPYAVDETNTVWFVGVAPAQTGDSTALFGINGVDTTAFVIPEAWNSFFGVEGIAARNGKVFMLKRLTYPDSSMVLQAVDVTSGVSVIDTFSMPPSLFNTYEFEINRNVLAATSADLYMRWNDSAEATLLKWHNGSVTVLNHSAFGKKYDYIRMVKTDYQDNIYFIGINEEGSFLSYSTNGVIWASVPLSHDQAPEQGTLPFEPYMQDYAFENLFAGNGADVFVLNPKTFKVIRYTNGEVSDQIDLSSYGIQNVLAFDVSPNGVFWLAELDDASDQLAVHKIVNGVHTMFTIQGVQDSSIWSDESSAATDDRFRFTVNQKVYEAGAVANAMITSVLDDKIKFNTDLNPYFIQQDTFYVYDGTAWETHAIPMSSAERRFVCQRPDSSYVIITDSVFLLDGNLLINTGLGYPQYQVYEVPDINKGIDCSASGEIFVMDYAGQSQTNPNIAFRRIDAALSAVETIALPQNSNLTSYGTIRYGGVFPTGSKWLLACGERHLIYDPQGTSGTVENPLPYNVLKSSMWYDYNDNGTRQWDEWYAYGLFSNNGMPASLGGSFQVVTGDTNSYFIARTSTAPINYHFSQDTVSHDFSGTYNNVIVAPAFRLIPDSGTHNIKVNLSVSGTALGYAQSIWVNAKNIAAEPVSGTLTLLLDSGLVSGIDSMTGSGIISGNVLTWNFNLVQGEQFMANVYTSVPLTSSVNDLLHYTLTGTVVQPDIDLSDNQMNMVRHVLSSYDPNEKTVEPAGLVDTGEFLTYTIHFQNTGNTEAYNIVIRDTVDSDFDMGTLSIESSSHPADVEIRNGNVLEFVFANIMLPDSNTNEPLSHGFIRYKIKPKATAGYGTQLTNTAYIYFDYNEPVVTNTTMNTLGVITGIPEIITGRCSLQLYPNPANGLVTVVSDKDPGSDGMLQISDVTGRTVLSVPMPAEKAVLNCSGLASGVYNVKVFNKQTESKVSKLVIIR